MPMTSMTLKMEQNSNNSKKPNSDVNCYQNFKVSKELQKISDFKKNLQLVVKNQKILKVSEPKYDFVFLAISLIQCLIYKLQKP